MDSETPTPIWPEDPIARLEAKIDNLRENHLHHLTLRVSILEKRFTAKQRWEFLTGLATLLMVAYLVFH